MDYVPRPVDQMEALVAEQAAKRDAEQDSENDNRVALAEAKNQLYNIQNRIPTLEREIEKRKKAAARDLQETKSIQDHLDKLSKELKDAREYYRKDKPDLTVPMLKLRIAGPDESPFGGRVTVLVIRPSQGGENVEHYSVKITNTTTGQNTGRWPLPNEESWVVSGRMRLQAGDVLSAIARSCGRTKQGYDENSDWCEPVVFVVPAGE